MKTTGQRIRQIRQELKMSQEQFGAIFGAGKSYISAVENDKSKLSVDNLVKLLVNYNVNINYVLAGIGKMFIAPKFEDVKDEVLAEVEKMLKEKGL